MSVQNQLDRIIGLVSDSHEKVKAKGGTTTQPYLLANLPSAIESIPEAVELPKAEEASFGGDVPSEGDYQIEGQTLDDIANAIQEVKIPDVVQVEYVETDGSYQCINSGYKYTSEKVKVRTEFELRDDSSYGYLIGSYSDGYYSLALCLDETTISVEIGNSYPVTDIALSANERHTVEVETFGDGTGMFTLDGVETSFSYDGQIDKQCEQYIFAQNDREDIDGEMDYLRLYSLQMYDNGVLVRDFVPAKDSFGNTGLFDKVNKVNYPEFQYDGDYPFLYGASVGVVEMDSEPMLTTEMATEIRSSKLPTLNNQVHPDNLEYGIEAFDADGHLVKGTLFARTITRLNPSEISARKSGSYLYINCGKPGFKQLVNENTTIQTIVDGSLLGTAKPEEVTKGKFFTSADGVYIEGTMEPIPSAEEVRF